MKRSFSASPGGFHQRGYGVRVSHAYNKEPDTRRHRNPHTGMVSGCERTWFLH